MEETENRNKKVKIFLKSGMILTVTISNQTNEHIIGTDKFNNPVIISISDIKLMVPKEIKHG